MPHSNQDTEVNIESYCSALKCWFVFDKTGFKAVGLIGRCGY
jgi:hypothetical protein